jgi:hypothetical protein
MKKTSLLISILLMLFALNAFATVTVETARVQYNCNGTTTAYTYPFEILANDDLLAITATSAGVESTLVLNTDYTVTGAGSSSGTLTLTAGSKCPSGSTLTMLRNIELQQQTDYVDGAAFSAESLEGAIDKQMLIIQQQEEKLARVPMLPKSSTLSGVTLDNPVAGEYLRWNTTADGIESTSSVSTTGSYTPSGTGAVARTVDAKLGEFLSVKDFGATGDGITDDAAAFQAAITAALAADVDLYVPAGIYNVLTGLTVTNGGTKSFNLKGAGQYLTQIVTPATGSPGALSSGSIITWTCTGPPTTISDMMILADTGGNRNIDALNITSSNGVTVKNLWLASAYAGLKVDSSSNIRISDVQAEYNTMDFYLYKSYMVTMNGYHSYRSLRHGVYVHENNSYSTAGTSGGIVLNAGSIVDAGYNGTAEGAGIHVDSLIPVSINGVEINSSDGTGYWPLSGITVTTGNVYIGNPLISWAYEYGIKAVAGNVTVMGGNIRKIGYYDQTTPWVTVGAFADTNVENFKVIGTTINSEGYGVYTKAKRTELIGITTTDCNNGGSTGSVNSTTGVVAINLDPQVAETHFKMIGSHLYNASGTGKTGLYITATATPTAGFVEVAHNDVYTNSFDTPLSSALPAANIASYIWDANTGLVKTEASGSSTINSGATSAVITHGLGLTPSAEHISIVGKENPSNSVGTIWVDTITSTQFTVNVENDPGASNWDFGWKARIR